MSRVLVFLDEVLHSIVKVLLLLLGYGLSSNSLRNGELALLKKLKSSDGVCLDIGANNGSYSELVLRYTRMSVLAFEPQELCQQSLEILNLRYKNRINIYPIALGAKDGTGLLHYEIEGSTTASLQITTGQVPGIFNTHSTPVNVRTLDTIVNLEPSIISINDVVELVKIDVEGNEYDVLNGSKEFIRKYKPRIIQLESNWHSLHSHQTIFQMAQLLPQYDLFQITPLGLVPRNPNSFLANIFRYSNFVFIRRNPS